MSTAETVTTLALIAAYINLLTALLKYFDGELTSFFLKKLNKKYYNS